MKIENDAVEHPTNPKQLDLENANRLIEEIFQLQKELEELVAIKLPELLEQFSIKQEMTEELSDKVCQFIIDYLMNLEETHKRLIQVAPECKAAIKYRQMSSNFVDLLKKAGWFKRDAPE